ncbi:MAG: response regulator [Myxococcaceae bacterium]
MTSKQIFTRERSRLKRLLPVKSLSGFVAATLAVLGISTVSYRAFQDRVEGSRRVTQTMEATQRLEALSSLLKDAETGQRGFLLTGAERYLEPYNQALTALGPAVEGARAALSNEGHQAEQFAALTKAIDAKMSELKKTVELRRTDPEAALELVRTDAGKQQMDQIRALVADLTRTERQLLEQRTTESDRLVSLTSTLTFGGAAVLLFLIITAAMLSSRDFRAQETQAWLKSGQNELGRAVQGEQSVQKTGENVASLVGRYLDVPLCAVWTADAGGSLSLAGTWGVSESAARLATAGSVSSRLGGLTEQALKSGQLIRIDDVPAGFFEVSSGLGARPARHLVVAPVYVDSVPAAVVEVGFLRRVATHELELLSQLAPLIGVAFRSAKYRENLKNLLEETQRQAEELQTQQEELRVNNEELEQQTRAQQQSQERLSNQQAELEEINAQLEEQTISLERQRDDLTNAQTALRRASTYKSEFLANMSHELRTPLNSSLILAKVLIENRDGNLNEEQLRFAQTIYSAGNDLLVLINDILDLSKIEAGKLDVRTGRVPVSRLIDELNDVFLPVAKDKALGFEITVAEGTPANLTTDPTRLSQILRNLLSNALKFTEQGGVSLQLRPAGGKVAFDVRDTGIGIAPSQHDVIFEAFRQADGTTNRKYGGTGLGLSISRDLAHLLGGELTVDSAPGRGSTFTLVLPVEYAGLPAQAPTGRTEFPAAPTDARGSPPRARLPARQTVSTGPRSILVIEDDRAFAQVVKDLAEELEFEVLTAHDAAQGLRLAKERAPSAIVLDVGLPDRSGLSVLDALKHSPDTRHIPVHIVSVADHTQAALEMGALGYALKPIRHEELVDALGKLEAKFTQKLRRVLVIEDDPIHREATCQLLKSGDVETVPVSTAAEALTQLSERPFDCVVLDLSLPDRTGFELLEEMTGRAEPMAPVIVYTGRSLSRDEEQQLRRFSSSIIIKGARSPERLLDEVTLFLHQVESELPPDQQRMLKTARHRDAVFEGRRVLIVEDDVRNIFALSSLLEPRGAKVEIARNGKEALNHLKNKPGVDLVLMDVMMPEMDGLEATREIRKQPHLQKLPVIALTAKAMADDRESCLAAGASDYIAKPLDVDKLLSLARVWMPR